MLSPDFVIRNPVLPEDLRRGPEGTKKYASAVITAVPDRKLVHHDILSKGDKVLIRWTNSGTNTGPLFGNPPTGKTYVATGFDLFRISDGKIKEFGDNIILPRGHEPSITYFYQLRGTIILAELPNSLAIAVTSDTCRVERLFNFAPLRTLFIIHLYNHPYNQSQHKFQQPRMRLQFSDGRKRHPELFDL